MKTIREMMEVMEHFDNGGIVEHKANFDEPVWGIICNPNWNWHSFDYRIKEEPKPVIKIHKYAGKLAKSKHDERQGDISVDCDGNYIAFGFHYGSQENLKSKCYIQGEDF